MQLIKKAFLLLLVSFTLHAVAFAQTPEKMRVLDSALTKLYERGMFNGAVLYAEQGKPLYNKSFGLSNIATREKLTAASAFNLASVSKQFMAMMIMILKEQGKLNYDDDVRKFIPGLPYEHITVQRLLTHTSGLPEYFELAQAYTGVLDTLTNESMIRLFKTYKPALRFQPGERWEYSNTGYVLLGSVIQAASGMPVAEFFKKSIVQPLGLKNTFVYHYKANLTAPASRVFGFQRLDGKNVPNDLVRLDGVIGDGNIYASAEDLLIWEQSLYGEKLVKKNTLSEALTPVQLNDGTTYPYGFGWEIIEKNKIYEHTGSWVGFLNLIYRDVEQKRTLIVLTSSSNARAISVANKIINGKPFQLPETQLIANVSLIDGTGAAPRKTSLRIKNNKIWETGDLTPFPGEETTDGQGMTLAPGFIDSHSHHASHIETHADMLAAVSQGVTTIVSGQDGGSYYIDSLEALLKRRPVAINIATYTGHATLREQVMGEKDLHRISTPDELEKMKALLRQEMSKGSLGLSTGLEYEGGFYSNRDEVLQLAKTAADSGGRYISHLLSEDVRLAEGLDQIIEIGRATKAPVQISHIKIALRDQWGGASRILAQLQKARSEGINITADCYPYDYWKSTLRVLFPEKDFTNPVSADYAVRQLFDPEKSVLSSFDAFPAYAGKSVSEIAVTRNEKPAQTLMWLIAEAERTQKSEGVMGKSMDEADVIDFLKWGQTNICSDGANSGHPRGYGAFTRVLGRYVRELKIMPLETAIYKMTGLTAEHLGLDNRGVIAPGAFADLVLFDPATVKDNATIQNNQALSDGVEKVWVNGKLVYQHKKSLGVYPGVFIKRN